MRRAVGQGGRRRQVVVDRGALNGLPAWTIPGEASELPASSAALLHPVKAAESVDTTGWSDSERMSRIDFLLHVKLNIAKLDAEIRNHFQQYLRDCGGENNYSERIRVCETMAFDFSPPCSIAEFLSAAVESGSQSPDAVLHLVRYKRAVAEEQKPRTPRTPRRKPPPA